MTKGKRREMAVLFSETDGMTSWDSSTAPVLQSDQVPDVQITPTLFEILRDKPRVAMMRLVFAAKKAAALDAAGDSVEGLRPPLFCSAGCDTRTGIGSMKLRMRGLRMIW